MRSPEFDISVRYNGPLASEYDEGSWCFTISSGSVSVVREDRLTSMFVVDITALLDGLRALLSSPGGQLSFNFRGSGEFMVEFTRGESGEVFIDSVPIPQRLVVIAVSELAESILDELESQGLNGGPAYEDLRDSLSRFCSELR